MVLDPLISQLSNYIANFQVKNHLLYFIEEILVLSRSDKLFQELFEMMKITQSGTEVGSRSRGLSPWGPKMP